jgi:ATP-dependent Zn protease
MFTVKSIKVPTLNKTANPISKVTTFIPNNQHIIEQPVRWEYDVFLYEVSKDHIVHANVTQDQKSAHLKLKDGSERDIMLPNGYDHITLFMQHDVEVNIIPSETLFSPLDICLFSVQLIFLARFAIVDWASKSKAKQDALNEINKKRDKESIKKSARLITEVCVDASANTITCTNSNANSNIKTTKSDMEVMRNDLMMSMSGAVAEDIITGVYSGPVGTTNDITHLLRIGYQIVLNYDIFDTPEQINSFVIETYRQCRKLMRKNYICLIRLQKEFNKTKAIDTNVINSLKYDIICNIKDDKI